jgi:hypothetical protein
MNATALLILLLVILAVLGSRVLLRMRIKRAVNQVAATLEHSNALDVRSARTIDGLGLRPPTFLQSMIRMRDFKPYALQVLMKAEVVLQTDGGGLYLSQDRLAATNVGKR